VARGPTEPHLDTASKSLRRYVNTASILVDLGRRTGLAPMTQSILLVDDSKTMREVFKVYLMGRQFEFLEAEDAERGLRLLRLVPVSLVIVDLKMPKMDGIAFLRHVRANELPTQRRVPVIVVTGDKSVQSEAAAMRAGANAFLQKPLDSTRAVEVVDRLLSNGAT
jgi:two-component system, chemotaxis family, chemotaxis protein CheY